MASKMKLNIESTGVLHLKKLRVGKGVPPGRQDESGNNFSQVEVYTTEFFFFVWKIPRYHAYSSLSLHFGETITAIKMFSSSVKTLF
jgi:hypothetical protein